MRKNLTDLFVQNVKQRGHNRADYLDMSDPGLVLRVSPSGVKSWSYLYKVPGEGGLTRTSKPRKGRQHRMTLGNYTLPCDNSALTSNENAPGITAQT